MDAVLRFLPRGGAFGSRGLRGPRFFGASVAELSAVAVAAAAAAAAAAAGSFRILFHPGLRPGFFLSFTTGAAAAAGDPATVAAGLCCWGKLTVMLDD